MGKGRADKFGETEREQIRPLIRLLSWFLLYEQLVSMRTYLTNLGTASV